MVEITGALIENEPTLLVDLNVLGKSRERKAARAGLSPDVPELLNRRIVLPNFVARFDSPDVSLVEGFTASLCGPTLLQLIPSIVDRVNQRIEASGYGFKRSRHQLTPHPPRLLEAKAACLFRFGDDAALFRRFQQRLLDQFDVVGDFVFDDAISAGGFATRLIGTDARIIRTPLVFVISGGDHNRSRVGAVDPEHFRVFRTRELAAVLSLRRADQVTHDRCEWRKRVRQLLVQLKIEFFVGISPFQIVAQRITPNRIVAAPVGYLREGGTSRGPQHRLGKGRAGYDAS